MYDKLSVAQLWISPGKGGEKGHTAQKCPHPKNPELYNKNRKAFMDKKSANNNNGSGGGKNNNSGGGKGNANPGYDRKAWDAKLAKQNIKIDTNCVMKCFCKKCGLNTTHSTGFHKVYVLNPAGFSLPDSHPYIVACAQLRALQGTQTPTPKPPPTTQPSGERTTGGHAGSISRAHIEQKLADLERTSHRPECCLHSGDNSAILFKLAGRSTTGSYEALYSFQPVKSVFVSMWRSFARLSKGSIFMLGCVSMFFVVSFLWGLLSMETLSYQVPVGFAVTVSTSCATEYFKPSVSKSKPRRTNRQSISIIVWSVGAILVRVLLHHGQFVHVNIGVGGGESSVREYTIESNAIS
eukprot:scaffold631_cov49-Cyclotella_meneghiniana.AAC.2